MSLYVAKHEIKDFERKSLAWIIQVGPKSYHCHSIAHGTTPAPVIRFTGKWEEKDKSTNCF